MDLQSNPQRLKVENKNTPISLSEDSIEIDGTLKVDGKEVKKLVLIEEEDVVGKPVYVSLKREQYVTAATKHLPPHEQEKRSTFKVKTVKAWEGGKAITPSEIKDEVPF